MSISSSLVTPTDAFHQIFAWLQPPSLSKCALVCKRWRSAVNSLPIWKSKIERNFSAIPENRDFTRQKYVALSQATVREILKNHLKLPNDSAPDVDLLIQQFETTRIHDPILTILKNLNDNPRLHVPFKRILKNKLLEALQSNQIDISTPQSFFLNLPNLNLPMIISDIEDLLAKKGSSVSLNTSGLALNKSSLAIICNWIKSGYIHELVMKGCYLTDQSVKELCESACASASKLTSLNLAFNSKITDASLPKLEKWMTEFNGGVVDLSHTSVCAKNTDKTRSGADHASTCRNW
jgi:hypothetical protein